jgi:hypothetical protein
MFNFNFAQQIQFWVGNTMHVGTVVRNMGNNVWGVTHVMNPNQQTQPEFTVVNQGGKWVAGGQTTVRTANANGSVPLAQLAYHAPAGEAVGLGDIMYRESYKNFANQPRANQHGVRRLS